MSSIPKVFDHIINTDLCIGCGLCVYRCQNNVLEMHWNDFGFLIPNIIGVCDLNGDCLSVCPFNPFPKEEIKTENEIANFFLKESINFNIKVGKYNNIYAGYSEEFRLTSSSGGIATYILTELIESGIVNYVFSVKESKSKESFYDYSICRNRDELVSSSKTKYYPVTLSSVFSKLRELDGKIAIVGVACFIKAIRLAQFHEPDLKEKIPFLVGIICGGIKSRFFTEYLSNKAGVNINNIDNPLFRVKDIKSTANDYSFSCKNLANNKDVSIKMSAVGDMWGTGLFKANSCDFCDDVTSELADISLGDAWLFPYRNDGKGNNVIVTRSTLAEKLIIKGKKSGKLHIEELSLESFLKSQQGSFNHRHKGLSVRLRIVNNKQIPPKRFINEKVNFIFIFVQRVRLFVRKKSLVIWKKHANALFFDNKMKNYLRLLRFITRIYHFTR